MKLKTITDEVFFPGTNAATLFALYTNAKLHRIVTDSATNITDKVGKPFKAYDGYCFGKNLVMKRNRLVVQSWRATDWPDDSKDSLFILRLEEEEGGTMVYMVHEGLPATMAKSILDGWREFYWSKWKVYLRLKSKSKGTKYSM